MLKNREELIELIKFGYDIKKIINSWDPIVLMEFCPEDEYEAEIKGIRNLVANNRNIDKKLLGQEIKKIFRYYFSNDYNSEKNIEENIASKIMEKSKKYKLSCIIPNYYDNENIIFKNEKEMDIYINLYIKIKEIINSWDPLKIMDISLDNEYCYEIKEITGNFNENVNVENLSNLINEVFKNTYNELYNANKNEEIKIAKELNKIGENR